MKLKRNDNDLTPCGYKSYLIHEERDQEGRLKKQYNLLVKKRWQRHYWLYVVALILLIDFLFFKLQLI
jgi:hypothetical protein